MRIEERLRIKVWGTSGTIPVWGPYRTEFGGNTTCIELLSMCLPANCRWFFDAGTGLYQACRELGDETSLLYVLFTHYHDDHNEGLAKIKAMFMKRMHIVCMGPIDRTKDPYRMARDRIREPYFPVSLDRMPAKLDFVRLARPDNLTIIVHPQAGVVTTPTRLLRDSERSSSKTIEIHGRGYPLSECLYISMMTTTHPNKAISYHVWERPTDSRFVLLTDHEPTWPISRKVKDHIKGAGLLLADSQYLKVDFAGSVGHGHGMGPSCVELAYFGGAQNVGLTHYSPAYDDDKLRQVEVEAKAEAVRLGYKGNVFLCRDFGLYPVR